MQSPLHLTVISTKQTVSFILHMGSLHAVDAFTLVLVLGVHYSKEIARWVQSVMCPLAHANMVSSSSRHGG